MTRVNKWQKDKGIGMTRDDGGWLGMTGMTRMTRND